MSANTISNAPFLSEVLPDFNHNQRNQSPTESTGSVFSEMILISIICGRTLTHIQDAADRIHPVTDQEFRRRQQFLSAVLNTRMTVLWTHITTNPDPVWVFMTLSAYMVGFMLCEAGESMSGLSPATQPQDVAVGLEVLLPVLGQLNYFQVGSHDSATT